VLTHVVEWAGAIPITIGARVFEKSQLPFHMVVTNVPGPRGTLHFLQAPMIEAHPMVPLFGHLSLGVALFSYGQTISWGVCGDRALYPDLHEFVRAIEHSFEQLTAHARRAPEGQARAAGNAKRSRAHAPAAAGDVSPPPATKRRRKSGATQGDPA
jgi:diacylglycerol O-acyltransferase